MAGKNNWFVCMSFFQQGILGSGVIRFAAVSEIASWDYWATIRGVKSHGHTVSPNQINR